MGSMLNIPSRMEGPEQKTIIGKPEITVSAKGIQNGTSVYLNDGADFGPDTKLGATTPGQYGPPYTTKTGIQESVNFAKPIRLLNGNFVVANYISIPNNWLGSAFSGIGSATNSSAQIAKSSSYIEASSGSIIRGNGGFVAGQTGTPNNVSLIFADFVAASNSNTQSAAVIDLSTPENHTNLNLIRLQINTAASGYSLIMDGNEDSFVRGCSITGILQWQTLAGNQSIEDSFIGEYDVGAVLANIKNSAINGPVKIISAAASSSYSTYNFNGVFFNQLATGIPTISYASYGDVFIYLENCVINAFQGSGNPIFSSSGTGKVTVILKNCQIIPLSGTTPDLLSSGFVGSALWDNATKTQSPGVVFPASGFGITTPAVPASGTSLANTFSSPVRVYITAAGTTTAYTITDASGNAVTFSTALTLGQEITLDPGESISITYTAAPSWKWYGI